MAIVIYNFLLPWSNFYENFTTVSTIISFFETFFKASITMFSRNIYTLLKKAFIFMIITQNILNSIAQIAGAKWNKLTK